MSYHGQYGPVGYTYNADNYCESCICGVIRKAYNLRPGTGQAVKGCNCTECILDRLAKLVLHGDRYDEMTFDSGEFPKTIPYHNDIHAECGPAGYGYGPSDPEWRMPYCNAVCGNVTCHEVIDGTSHLYGPDTCPAYEQRKEQFEWEDENV